MNKKELEKKIEKYLFLFEDYKKSLREQIEEKDNKIAELEKDIEWYKIWHNKFKKQIEDLTTELETYRPTKLHGNGQCSCYRCEQKVGFNRHWTDWCYSYKGHTYCSDCLREILKEEHKDE